MATTRVGSYLSGRTQFRWCRYERSFDASAPFLLRASVFYEFDARIGEPDLVTNVAKLLSLTTLQVFDYSKQLVRCLAL